MAEKEINSRIQQKHDIEENWLKATNFIPKAGEIIVYDVDNNYNYPRVKIGDGVNYVNDLKFIISNTQDKLTFDTAPTADSTNPVTSGGIYSTLNEYVTEDELNDALDETMLLKNVTAVMPSSVRWNSITYGNGKFVAVANDSNIAAYSINGTNWIVTDMPTTTNWNSVTYGDGKFVAIGNTTSAAYSTDGINWTASTMPISTTWKSVTHGDGKFVAVGLTDSACAYSTDGINWIASTMPTATNWWSVTYGDGKFVAVCAMNSAMAQGAYSTDGINWTSINLTKLANWSSVVYGNGVFVAVIMGDTSAAYSTDGINWTASTMPIMQFWSSVTYGNGIFIAVANNNGTYAAISADGINWTGSPMTSAQNWRSVTYGDGKFVATCDTDELSISTDGTNWKNKSIVITKVDGTNITADIKALIDTDTIVDISGKQDVLTFDAQPTAGSTNPITSGGVKAALDNLELITVDDIDEICGTTLTDATSSEVTF